MGDGAEVAAARVAWAQGHDPAVAEILEYARQAPALDFARSLVRARVAALSRVPGGPAQSGKVVGEILPQSPLYGQCDDATDGVAGWSARFHMPITAPAVPDQPTTLACHPSPLGILRLVREASGTYAILLADSDGTRVLAEAESLILAEALFRREARHG